jgi:LacI family transcriptional regulator
MKDIAAHVGVSQVTVSHVLRGRAKQFRISPGTAKRVQKAAEELGYYPSALARNFQANRSNVIALAVGDLSDPFWAQLAVGAQLEAEGHGYLLVVVNTLESEEKERLIVDMLRERRVDGIILSPGHPQPKHLAALHKDGLPFVLVDRTIDGLDVPSVIADSISGVEQAVDYLVSRGHRRIAYVGGTHEISTFRDRWNGYRQALARHHLKPGPHAITRSDPDAAREAVRKMFKQRPAATAIIAANMWLTVGVLRAVPEDVVVVGFDDLFLPELLRRPVHAIVQPVKELGSRSVRLLLETILRPGVTRHVILPTRLIVRGAPQD